MRNLLLVLVAVAMLVVMQQCRSTRIHATGPETLRDFYFPVDSLFDPKVYVFESEDKVDREYWKLAAVKENGIKLTTTIFDMQRKPEQEMVERIDSSGVELVQYVDLALDFQGMHRNPATIKWGQVYRWHLDTFLITAYSGLEGGHVKANYITRRERRLVEYDSLFVLGEKRKTAVFADFINLDIYDPTWNYIGTDEFRDTLHFAKHIGLAQFSRTFSNGETLKMKLEDILPSEEWNNKE